MGCCLKGLPCEAVTRRVITHLDAECSSDAEGDIIMAAGEAKWAVATDPQRYGSVLDLVAPLQNH